MIPFPRRLEPRRFITDFLIGVLVVKGVLVIKVPLVREPAGPFRARLLPLPQPAPPLPRPALPGADHRGAAADLTQHITQIPVETTHPPDLVDKGRPLSGTRNEERVEELLVQQRDPVGQ